MIRKVLTAVIVSSLLWIVPAVGNPEALQHAHLYLLLAFGVLAGVFQPAYKPMDKQAPSHDHGTATQLVWTVYLTQLLAVLEAVYLRYPEAFRWDAVAIVAGVLALLGLVIRTWAFHTLGQFFTWHINVVSEHQVVRHGPYRWIRHPSYTGAYLMWTGSIFFIHAWIVGTVTLFALLYAFLRRIRHEETWLRKELGEEYAAYSRETKALVPFVY